MKKILLFISLFFLIFFIASFFILSRNQQKKVVPQTNLTPPTVVEKVNDLIIYTKEPVGVIFNLATSIPTVPSELPVYKTSSTKNQVTTGLQIATALGITTPLKSIGDKDATITIWSNEKNTIAVNSDSLTVMSTELNSTIEQFIKKFNLLPQNLVLKLVQQKPFNNHDGEITTSPDSMFLSYEMQITNSYPLIFSGGSVESITALVDQSGIIRSLSFPFPPGSIDETERKPLLSIASAIKNLNQGKGTLLSVDGEVKKSLEPEPNFNAVTITQTRVGYYLMSNKVDLLPVYIFEGVGINKQVSQKVKYLLRATD